MTRENLTEMVRVRFKRSEVEEIDRLADARDLNRSEFVRFAIMVIVRLPPDVANDLFQIPPELAGRLAAHPPRSELEV